MAIHDLSRYNPKAKSAPVLPGSTVSERGQVLIYAVDPSTGERCVKPSDGTSQYAVFAGFSIKFRTFETMSPGVFDLTVVGAPSPVVDFNMLDIPTGTADMRVFSPNTPATALTHTASLTPGAGQYHWDGAYKLTFNVADAGPIRVLYNYNYTAEEASRIQDEDLVIRPRASDYYKNESFVLSGESLCTSFFDNQIDWNDVMAFPRKYKIVGEANGVVSAVLANAVTTAPVLERTAVTRLPTVDMPFLGLSFDSEYNGAVA